MENHFIKEHGELTLENIPGVLFRKDGHLGLWLWIDLPLLPSSGFLASLVPPGWEIWSHKLVHSPFQEAGPSICTHSGRLAVDPKADVGRRNLGALRTQVARTKGQVLQTQDEGSEPAKRPLVWWRDRVQGRALVGNGQGRVRSSACSAQGGERGKKQVALTGLTSFLKEKELHLTPSANFWTVYLGSHADKIPADEQASRADKNQTRQTPYLDLLEPEGIQCPLSNQSLSIILIIPIDVG